jgi:hypothetical protein
MYGPAILNKANSFMQPGPETTTNTAPPKRWQGRLLTICFAIFAFELGLFLIIFPWQDSWTLNYFQGISPSFENLWDEPSFKGLVTGLGFVNIYVALLQIGRLIKRRA